MKVLDAIINSGSAEIYAVSGLKVDKTNKYLEREYVLVHDAEEINPVLVNSCDDTANWSVYYGSGTLTNDTSDYKEGSASLYADGGTSDADGDLIYRYDPSAVIDLSDDDFLTFWIKVAEGGDFKLFVEIVDDSGNWRYWDGRYDAKYTFKGGDWVKVVLPLRKGSGESDTPPDLANIERLYVGIVGASPNTSYILKVDGIKKDEGGWVKVEVSVPDELLDEDGDGYYRYVLYSWKPSVGYGDYAWGDLKEFLGYGTTTLCVDTKPWYNGGGLWALSGDNYGEMYHVASAADGAGVYMPAWRGETTTGCVGTGGPSSITYSSNYGVKRRIGFALKMPPSTLKGDLSGMGAMNKVRLKVRVYYDGDCLTTYEFDDSDDDEYGLGNVSKGYLLLFRDSEAITDFLQLPSPDCRPTSLSITYDVDEEIREVEISWPSEISDRVYWGQSDADPTRDSNSNGIPDNIEEVDDFVARGGFG